MTRRRLTRETPIPTYTHLQQAQATTLGNHLLAHGWALSRDRDRLADLDRRLAVSPLGAGASAGSSLPLDPDATATALGFESSFSNSLDAVGSRDLAAEFGFVLAQAMVNLSRLAEELVLWATSEFGWLSLADSFATGSSALPQKKNPDVAELARGRAATAIGHLNALLILQKGLPLTYNRDLQEDKAALFALDDTLSSTCNALAGMIAATTFHPPAPSSGTQALGIAENLVRKGVPFRTAHELVGKLVSRLDGRPWAEAGDEDLEKFGLERGRSSPSTEPGWLAHRCPDRRAARLNQPNDLMSMLAATKRPNPFAVRTARRTVLARVVAADVDENVPAIVGRTDSEPFGAVVHD